MKIEGVPDGYELVRIGEPKKGEFLINDVGGVVEATHGWMSIRPVVRKKPKQYRPFANGEEFKPHLDRWIHQKIDGQRGAIVSYNDGFVRSHSTHLTYKQLFDTCCFDDDGSPCGVEVQS